MFTAKRVCSKNETKPFERNKRSNTILQNVCVFVCKLIGANSNDFSLVGIMIARRNNIILPLIYYVLWEACKYFD